MTKAISMEKIYEELKRIEKNMVTKKEVEALTETINVLSNHDTMQQIAGSIKDIKEGNTEEITSVQDMLNEM